MTTYTTTNHHVANEPILAMVQLICIILTYAKCLYTHVLYTYMWLQPLACLSPLAGPSKPEPPAPSALLNYNALKRRQNVSNKHKTPEYRVLLSS